MITMLPEGRHVRAVYMDQGGVCRGATGTLLTDCSTIDVEPPALSGGGSGARLCHGRCARFRRRRRADAGSLTFMVGGTEAAFARAQPVLAAMGKAVIHAGARATAKPPRYATT